MGPVDVIIFSSFSILSQVSKNISLKSPVVYWECWTETNVVHKNVNSIIKELEPFKILTGLNT